MPEYALVKSIHVAAVAASCTFFAVRGCWMLFAPNWLQYRWVRVAPHVVDTVLLASAIALAVMARLDPLANPWLATKILALVAYVVIGSIALRRGKTRRIRAVAFAVALVLFAFIVSVAITRDPAGFLHRLA